MVFLSHQDWIGKGSLDFEAGNSNLVTTVDLLVCFEAAVGLRSRRLDSGDFY